MKATLFAVILSLFVVSFPVRAVEITAEPDTPLQTKQTIHKIDLNKADAKTLSKSYKGIGKKRAEAIVSYRETHGGFKSVDELANVRGLGKSFVNSHLEQLQAVFAVE